jgi:hypothetical protein
MASGSSRWESEILKVVPGVSLVDRVGRKLENFASLY